MITATLLAVLIVLMALRVPVSIAIGIAAIVALIMADLPLDVLPRMMIDSVDSYALLAVPFFVLAGNLMNATGITERIFDFARALYEEGRDRQLISRVRFRARLLLGLSLGSPKLGLDITKARRHHLRERLPGFVHRRVP